MGAFSHFNFKHVFKTGCYTPVSLVHQKNTWLAWLKHAFFPRNKKHCKNRGFIMNGKKSVMGLNVRCI